MNTQELPPSDNHKDVKLSDTQLFLLFNISWYVFWWWAAKFIKSFKYQFQTKHMENDFINRICAATHGTLILVVALFVVCTTSANYPDVSNNASENKALLFSISYFIYDTIAMRYYGVSEICIETHHLATIGLYLGTLYTGHGGRLIMIGLIVAECSNLVMHIRTCLTYVEMKYTKLRSLMQGLYFGLYIPFRGIGGPYILYQFTQCSGIMWLFPLFAIYLIAQSYYSFPIMAKVFWRERKVSRTLKKMTPKVKKFWFSHNPLLNDHMDLLDDPNDARVF